jgi:hypothetical protein
LVYVDPGKIRLYTMIGKPVNKPDKVCNHKKPKNKECSRCKDEYKIFKYTNRRRLRDTKRLDLFDKLNKYREIVGIKELEKEFIGTNSKSCVLSTFLVYVSLKKRLDIQLREKYNAIIFRKYKWYYFINKQRSEQNLINEIKGIYGNNCVLIMGDWSVPKQMKNFISTPMIGLKRRLRKEIEIINIDEYNTSAINNKTKTKCDNLTLKIYHKTIDKSNLDLNIDVKDKSNLVSNDVPTNKPDIDPNKDNIKKKAKYGFYKNHSILTYKMGNDRTGCINRDRNAVLNMKEIGECLLKRLPRPKAFCREKKVRIPKESSTAKLKKIPKIPSATTKKVGNPGTILVPVSNINKLLKPITRSKKVPI